MRRLAAAFLLALTLVSCSSPHAYVRMRNIGTQPVREVELNYGVMFGASELKPGELRQRYVKFSDPADLQIRFYDSANQLHTSQGPHIESHQGGVIEADISDGGNVKWVVTKNN